MLFIKRVVLMHTLNVYTVNLNLRIIIVKI